MLPNVANHILLRRNSVRNVIGNAHQIMNTILATTKTMLLRRNHDATSPTPWTRAPDTTWNSKHHTTFAGTTVVMSNIFVLQSIIGGTIGKHKCTTARTYMRKNVEPIATAHDDIILGVCQHWRGVTRSPPNIRRTTHKSIKMNPSNRPPSVPTAKFAFEYAHQNVHPSHPCIQCTHPTTHRSSHHLHILTMRPDAYILPTIRPSIRAPIRPTHPFNCAPIRPTHVSVQRIHPTNTSMQTRNHPNMHQPNHVSIKQPVHPQHTPVQCTNATKYASEHTFNRACCTARAVLINNGNSMSFCKCARILWIWRPMMSICGLEWNGTCTTPSVSKRSTPPTSNIQTHRKRNRSTDRHTSGTVILQKQSFPPTSINHFTITIHFAGTPPCSIVALQETYPYVRKCLRTRFCSGNKIVQIDVPTAHEKCKHGSTQDVNKCMCTHIVQLRE